MPARLSALAGSNRFNRKNRILLTARMMHMAWPGDTFGGMRAVGRLAGGDPGVIADAGLGVAGAGLIAAAAWGSPRLIGSEAITGPSWLLALLPLLVGMPLVLRRRAPLLMWLVIWAGIGLLCLIADNSVRGLAFTFVLFAAAYSLGAHAGFRRAVAPGWSSPPRSWPCSATGASWRWPSRRHHGSAAVALSFLQLVAIWPGRRSRPRPQAGRLAGRAERGLAAPG